MAGPNEPNNESVRVDLPLPTAGKPPKPNIKPHETVRIQFPFHDSRDAAAAQSFRAPSPSAIAPAPPTPDSLPLEPRKETAGISPAPAAEKAQPFVATPNLAPRNPPVAVASAGKNRMLLWWILLGISAVILIIQIWTYFS